MSKKKVMGFDDAPFGDLASPLIALAAGDAPAPAASLIILENATSPERIEGNGDRSASAAAGMPDLYQLLVCTQSLDIASAC